MATLTNEMALAWREKAERLSEKLGHMEHGFALFHPEVVEQTRVDLHKAIGWVGFWTGRR